MTDQASGKANSKLKLGYKASAEQFGPRRLLNFAVEAEACGFESVWVSDHFTPWRHTDGHAPFALSWLAAVGEHTQRVLLGTSVLTPLFRYPPAASAHGVVSASGFKPGRRSLGRWVWGMAFRVGRPCAALTPAQA